MSRWILLLAIILLGFHYPITTPVLLQMGVNTFVANALIKSLIAGLFLISLFGYTWVDRREHRLAMPLIIFFALYGLRLLFDVLIKGILVDQSATYVLGYFFGLTLLPALAIIYFLRPSDLPKLHQAMFIALILANLSLFAYVLNNGLSAEDALSGRLEVEGELEGTAVINPILVGLVGANLAAFAMGRLALFPLGPRGQIVHVGIVVLGLANLLMGGSRGPALGFAFCFLIVFYTLFTGSFGGTKLRTRASMWVYAALIFIGFIYLVVTEVVSIYLFERFTMMFDGGVTGGSEERDFIYARAWQDFLDHPIVGSSYLVSFGGWLAHNFALDALMSTGLTGGVFFALAMFWMLRGVYRLLRGSAGPYGYSIGLVAICFLTIGTTSGSVGQSPEVWLFAVIATILGNQSTIDRRTAARAPVDRAAPRAALNQRAGLAPDHVPR
jgi:O-antigen ligase